MKSDLTPAEDLMIEVLAARYRLGEQIWTFRSDQRGIANRLEAKGLIHTFSGQVERTFRAGLTTKGIEVGISPYYQAPIFGRAQFGLKQAIEKLLEDY